MLTWKQEFRAPFELYEDSLNSQTLSLENRTLLETSIKENGLDQHICATPDGLILVGSQRYRILAEKRVEFIAVYIPHGDFTERAPLSEQIISNQNMGSGDDNWIQKEIDTILGLDCSSDGVVKLEGVDTSAAENEVRDIIKSIDWSEPDKSDRKIDRYMVTLAFDFEKEADQVIEDIAPIVYRYAGATIRKRCRYFTENRKPRRKKWI